MSESQPSGGPFQDKPRIPADGAVAKTPAPKKRDRRTRILQIVAAVLAAGFMLLLVAPTILSTSPFVAIALGQVNKQLNGKVQLSSLSLGWFTGIKAQGLRVDDAGGTQIAAVDHASISYPLIKAITGSLSLGDIVLDGVSFDARMDSDGKLNFAKLAKSSPAASTPPTAAPALSTETSKPSKLPNVSLNFKLTNCHGTFSQAGKPTVDLTKLEGEVKIPNINDPITDTFNGAVKVGDSPEGTIAIDGTAAVIKSNAVAMDSANLHQTIEVRNLDLQVAKPFLSDSVGVSTLAGTMGVHVVADIAGGKSADIDTSITATKPIAIGGTILKGDTFSTNTFIATIPKLSGDFPDGLSQWQTGRIKVGTDAGSSPILLKMDQGQLTVTADLTPAAILNLIASRKPGASGQLVVASSFDLARIIPQLRNTTSLAQGVLIQTAGFTQNLKLTMTPDKATLVNSADSTRVTGTTRLANGQLQPISVDPIHISVSADDLGGGGMLPDLHAIALNIQAPFATGQFEGESLSDLHGNLTANLTTMTNQIRQFVDLGKIKLGGDVAVNLSGKGDITQAPYQASLQATLDLKNVSYSDDSAQPTTKPVLQTIRVSEPLVQMVLSAEMQGTATTAVETVKNAVLTVKVGDPGAPSVDILAQVPSVTVTGTSAGSFVLPRFLVDLSKLQKELAAVPPGQAGIVIPQGLLNITSSGKFNGGDVSLDSLGMALDHLYLARQVATGQQVLALAGEAVNLNLAADLNRSSSADGKSSTTTVRVKNLVASDYAQVFNVHKSGSGDLLLTTTSDGALAGQGQVDLMVQLGSVSAIANILKQEEVTAKTSAGTMRSGLFSGTLAMAPVGAVKTAINGNFKLDNVVVTTDTATLPPQAATLTLKATADQAARTIGIETAGINSNLATASITGASISLAAASVLDELQSAHWQVNVPDLKPVMDLANAYSTPTPAAAAEKSSTATPLPPMQINSGVIAASGDVSLDGSTLKVSVNQLSGQNIAFTRGDIHYAAKPIDTKLQLAIQSGDGKTLMEQIQQVQVTQLTGNLGIATLSMPTPISISGLSSTPAATGAIQLVGNLTDLTTLLAAMDGEKPDVYPYRGDYTLSENIATQASTTSLKGGMQIAKFQTYDGNNVTFSEDQVAIANDVALTMAGDDESVTINSLTAAMQSSGAMNISMKNGSIANLQTARKLQLQLNVAYDLEKLWPIMQPMMGDSYKTLKITGSFQKQFNVTGSYPANQPSTVAIKTLHADGDLSVATLDYDGVSMQNFVVPFTLDNGLFVTVYAGKPAGQNTAPVASCNGGSIDLSNLTVDLTQDPPRLSTPPSKALLSQITVNPVFAGSVLANMINNPLFADGKTGLIDVSLDDCTNLPLGNLVTQQSPANTGKADLRVSVTKINIGLPPNDQLASILKQTSFEANVKDGTVSVAKGISTEHINFNTGPYVLSFDGGVRLSDESYVNMVLGFPLKIIAAKTHLVKGKAADYVPDQIKVPLEGTVSKTSYRFDKTVPQAIADAAAKALAGGLFGGNKDNGDGNGGNGGDNANPLGDLLKKLQKKQGN